MNGTVLGVLVGLALGALAAALIDRARRMRAASAQAATQETAARIVEEARKEAATLRTESELRAKDLVPRDSSLKPKPRRSAAHRVAGLSSKDGGITGATSCRSDAGAFAGPLSP